MPAVDSVPAVLGLSISQTLALRLAVRDALVIDHRVVDDALEIFFAQDRHKKHGPRDVSKKQPNGSRKAPSQKLFVIPSAAWPRLR